MCWPIGHLPAGLGFETAAPILYAGVTVYKGLKENDTKPGDTVVISGIGGLGPIAVQYARAMGRDVIAVDISEESWRSPARWERAPRSMPGPPIRWPRSRPCAAWLREYW